MADIFISYKKEDAGRVNRIVEALRSEGFSVWWDHAITPGAQWDQTIQRELNAAQMVIAVWSQMSVDAPWVKEEAAVGKAKGRLLPVRIDQVEPPLGFGLIQMADLVGWEGQRGDNPQWSHFLSAVRVVLSGQPATGFERPVAKKRNHAPIWISLAVVLLGLLGAGVYAFITLQNINTVSIDYESGSNTTITRTPAPGAVAPGEPAIPSERETALFEKAQASKLKADFLDYLQTYPDGAYALQVRDSILPFCAAEERPGFRKTQASQSLRGVSDTGAIGMSGGYPSEEAACVAAKEDVSRRAEQMCRLMIGSGGRNAQHALEWNACSCQSLQTGWICSVDPIYRCDWEMAVTESVEVCK